MGLGKTYSTKYLVDSNGNTGAANQVLVSTATGVDWVDGSGSGIIGGPYLPLSATSAFPLTGDLYVGTSTASTDRFVRTYHSDNSYTEMRGYGIITNRTAAYVRPVGDKTQVLAIGNDGNTWNYVSQNANYHTFLKDTSEWMRIDITGNVGIGMTLPYTKLVVGSRGTAAATSILAYDGIAFDFYNDGPPYKRHGVIISQAADTSESVLDFNTKVASGTNSTKMTILGNGNVGIGTTTPKAKLDVNGRFCVDSKTHNLTNAFTTCLTVNLSSHTGCYVTLTCFGDWGSHSAAAYRGEFFLQNGANSYAEPGIILRQDDNTSNGADQIVCQILDPTGTGNPKDFEIQIRTTATTGTTSFTGQLTYTVQGQFNSIT
jgi:hypothetical protein